MTMIRACPSTHQRPSPENRVSREPRYHPTNGFPMRNRVLALFLQMSYELLYNRYGPLYVFIYVNF